MGQAVQPRRPGGARGGRDPFKAVATYDDDQVAAVLDRIFGRAMKAARVLRRSVFLGLGARARPIVDRWRAAGFGAILIDPSTHPALDLGRAVVLNRLRGWVRGSCVLGVWGAPSFGLLGPVASVLSDCVAFSVPSACELPQDSQSLPAKLCAQHSQCLVLHMCQLGSPCMRPTRIWAWRVPAVPHLLDRQCSGGHCRCSCTGKPHAPLTGVSQSGVSWGRVANSYPKRFSRFAAEWLSECALAMRRTRIDKVALGLRRA